MLTLRLSQGIFDELVEYGKGQAPIEACGILAGARGGGVEKFYEMSNADNSADHFTLVPEEQFKVVKAMRADGHVMLSVFHSHPETPARPSEEDIHLAVMPGAVYTILSLAGDEPDLKAFEIEDGVVTPMAVEISKD